MKKLGVIVKETLEKELKESIKNSESLFVVKYSGLSGPDLTTLRMALSATRARICVVKNSVARRALKSSGLEGVIKSIEGPCGLVFVADEPVDASKALFNFSKEHDKLKLEGGMLKDRLLEKKDIEAMAKLPNKQMMRALAVSALKGPINGLVFVLNGNLRKLVVCLDQIRSKKGS